MAVTARPGNLADASDELLADRAGDGDLRAFETLIRRHQALLTVTARRVLGSTSDVDDIVQDTIMTAWRQLPGLINTAAVKGWLVRITTRKAIDRIRARRDHDDITDHENTLHDTAVTPERSAEALSRSEAITAAVNALPVDQRRCWVLKEMADYSYTDISEELGIPVSTVRGALSRARKSLMRDLEEWR